MTLDDAPQRRFADLPAKLAVGVLSAIAVAGFSLAIWTAWLFHGMPDAGDLVDYRPPTATRVYAWDGTLLGEFSRERRIYVPYDQMPPQLVRAFLAAEDKNFFNHGGVDVQGLGRAAVRALPDAIQGRRLEGGSTITQQVAKNVLLNNDATIGRKLKEAVLAQRLEQVLTKEQILELYLNEIWLGYRSYGVGAAAYNYFGKSLDQLTLAECAYLASLPKGPDNYHPIRRKAQATARRNWVLGQMEGLRWAAPTDVAIAQAADLKVQAAPARARYRDADYFVEEVRRRGLGVLPRLNEGGYYMRTTLDPRLQSIARESLMKGLEQYDRRHGWRGAPARAEPGEAWEARALKLKRPAERPGWRPALVTSASRGGVQVRMARRLVRGEAPEDEAALTGSLAGEDVSWAFAGRELSVGDIVFVERPEGGGALRLRQIPAVNGALVAVEPQSGRVLAMVGGYSFSLSSFNRATQAMRQPGSSFKPFVYAAALSTDKFTPASTVMDSAITFADWTPENYDRRYYGALTLRRALEQSRNAVTVRVAQAVGMGKIVQLAKDAGVVDEMAPVLAMALGAGETTPFRMTGAYSAFVNGGRRIEPHLIELVQDREGKVLLRADKRPCDGCNRPFSGQEGPRLQPLGKPLMDPVVAYQVTNMLQGAVQRGTATAASGLGRPIAGKTGTTNEYRSAWFVGYTPDLIVGTFIGFDDNRSLGESETGGVAALPVFVDFMGKAMKGEPAKPFRAPKEAKIISVGGFNEAFRPGTEPRPQVASGGGGASAGPIPYSEAFGSLRNDPAPAPATAAPPAPAAPSRPRDSMDGLY